MDSEQDYKKLSCIAEIRTMICILKMSLRIKSHKIATFSLHSERVSQ